MTEEFPGHPFGWSILGALLGQSGRREEALRASQEALKLAPEDAGAHINFGALLHDLGRFEEAEAICGRVPSRAGWPWRKIQHKFKDSTYTSEVLSEPSC